jgi:HEAT repeat protein
MTSKDITKVTIMAGAATLATNKSKADVDSSALDEAIKALKTYDWGADRKILNPIDQAIVATHDDAEGRKALERRLVRVLNSGISRSAQDFVCRKLKLIGTGISVKALAKLLDGENTSHIARYALERIPGKKPLDALRAALPTVDNKIKAGIIGSLGVRRDKKSTKDIAKLLTDSDAAVSKAAIHALALIGTMAAAKELSKFAQNATCCTKIQVADACLICAEQLLADGNKERAIALYKELRSGDQPNHIKVAATKGMLTAAAKN